MSILVAETNAEDKVCCNVVDTTNQAFAYVIEPTKYRDYSVAELESMPAEDVKHLLLKTPCIFRTPSGLTLTTGEHTDNSATTIGMRQYVTSGVRMVSIPTIARNIHDVLLRNSGDSTGSIKATHILNMPYPVLAMYEYEAGVKGILFKVPEHTAVFDSRSAGITGHRYHCPSLLFFALVNSSYDITWCGVSMFTLDSVNPKLAKIAHLPFPNIYMTDGRICTGAMRFSDADTGSCNSIGEACTRLVTLVLGSGWRLDLTPDVFPSGLVEAWERVYGANTEKELLGRTRSASESSYCKKLCCVLDLLATQEGKDVFCNLHFPTAKTLEAVLLSENPCRGMLV